MIWLFKKLLFIILLVHVFPINASQEYILPIKFHPEIVIGHNAASCQGGIISEDNVFTAPICSRAILDKVKHGSIIFIVASHGQIIGSVDFPGNEKNKNIHLGLLNVELFLSISEIKELRNRTVNTDSDTENVITFIDDEGTVATETFSKLKSSRNKNSSLFLGATIHKEWNAICSLGFNWKCHLLASKKNNRNRYKRQTFPCSDVNSVCCTADQLCEATGGVQPVSACDFSSASGSCTKGNVSCQIIEEEGVIFRCSNDCSASAFNAGEPEEEVIQQLQQCFDGDSQITTESFTTMATESQTLSNNAKTSRSTYPVLIPLLSILLPWLDL